MLYTWPFHGSTLHVLLFNTACKKCLRECIKLNDYILLKAMTLFALDRRRNCEIGNALTFDLNNEHQSKSVDLRQHPLKFNSTRIGFHPGIAETNFRYLSTIIIMHEWERDRQTDRRTETQTERVSGSGTGKETGRFWSWKNREEDWIVEKWCMGRKMNGRVQEEWKGETVESSILV